MKVVDPELRRRIRESCFCELCRRWFMGGVDAMHVLARGMGGGGQVDIEENLLGGCRICHTRAHAGAEGYKQADLWRAVARRLRRSPGEVENHVREVLRAPKGSEYRNGKIIYAGAGKHGWRCRTDSDVSLQQDAEGA